MNFNKKIATLILALSLTTSSVLAVESEKAYQKAIIKLNNSMYIAFAPEYEIENTETFNFKNNYAPASLDKIDEKKDLSTLLNKEKL